MCALDLSMYKCSVCGSSSFCFSLFFPGLIASLFLERGDTIMAIVTLVDLEWIRSVMGGMRIRVK